MPKPIQYDAASIDFTARYRRSTTVAASPAAAAETTICTITVPIGDLSIVSGIEVVGWCAYTVGTNGTAGTLKIRQTDTSGTTIASTGALTRTAAQLVDDSIAGFDTAPAGTSQVYVLTLTITAGSAASTVSAAFLRALVI
jgi:hypothetical protein